MLSGNTRRFGSPGNDYMVRLMQLELLYHHLYPDGAGSTGRNAGPSQADTSSANSWAIETRNLTKVFAGFIAVKNVNLKIQRGTIHALIGPNGAGKTTCFNLITKFLHPSSGEIFYNNKDITNAKPAEVSRLGIVRSFQISAVFPDLTVLENVRIALQRPLRTSYYFWRNERSLDVLDHRASALLHDVGLEQYSDTVAKELSYGRKRALELATTIAQNPDVLLLDEPTAGMSHDDIAPVTDLIRRVSKNRTVLMVEHNLSVVADLSDRITVLARGEILAEGNYAEVSTNSEVIDAYMGTGHE